MATYVLLSSLTDEGAATITKKPTRIRDVNKEIEKLGVKVQSQYALLGPYDFLSVVAAPDNEPMARHTLNHASIRVREISRSREFYEGVLGFSTAPRPDLGFPGAWYDLGGG